MVESTKDEDEILTKSHEYKSKERECEREDKLLQTK